jgi:NitT/TauT family transport system substrate-binding protein
MKKLFAILIAVAAMLAGPTRPVAAEVDDFRIALQFGVGYLPLFVLQDQKLVEKHLAAAGLGASKVTWSRLASGVPMNDALLSGQLHVASGGVAPMLTLWGATKGQVKAVLALCAMPLYMLSNTGARSVKDLTPKDRIAMPGAGISIQTIVLEMAAEQAFGEGQHRRFSSQFVNLPHPEALAALLTRREVTAVVSSPPFQYQGLEQPGITRVFNSYDVLGGPGTFLVTWATSKFREENPRTWKAFLGAYHEAVELINRDRKTAAEIYLRASGDKTTLDNIVKQLNDPELKFTAVPEQTMKFAAFMHKVGRTKLKAESWKDYFHPEAHALPGS